MEAGASNVTTEDQEKKNACVLLSFESMESGRMPYLAQEPHFFLCLQN